MASPPDNSRTFIVAEDDDGIRLDRWFKRHLPEVNFNLVSRWARTGMLKVDDQRVAPGDRVATGQKLRIPPAEAAPAEEVEPVAEAPEEPQSDDAFDAVVADIRKRVDRAKSFNAVTDVMLHPDTQAALGDLPPGLRDELRDHAKARLVALGWPSKGKKAA